MDFRYESFVIILGRSTDQYIGKSSNLVMVNLFVFIKVDPYNLKFWELSNNIYVAKPEIDDPNDYLSSVHVIYSCKPINFGT